jgi:DNA polymerase (family 10)
MPGKRAEIDFDMDAVLKEAKEQNVCVELNASVFRLDLNDVHCKRAKEIGVKVAINSDAHNTREFDVRFGVAQARRGWLEKHDVINTLPWKDFAGWIDRRKKAGK